MGDSMPALGEILSTLEPISALSPGRIQELASLSGLEKVSQGLNPFRMNVVQSEQLLYLLEGQLSLVFNDGQAEIIVAGAEQSHRPVTSDSKKLKDAVALTDIEILRVDADLLDIMLTWDQLAEYEKSRRISDGLEPQVSEWMQNAGIFSAEALRTGIFKSLPPANVEALFCRFQRIPVTMGQVVIKQGDQGDYYYLIESGTAQVTRESKQHHATLLATLGPGQAFGEEALVSGNSRNATVTMQSAGILLRLSKPDFEELLRAPLLKQVSKDEAEQRVRKGARLIDVRTPAEYNFKHFPEAINLPLHDIRNAMTKLDKHDEYVLYCETGRRATAATFILAQQGFNSVALTS